MMTDAPPALTHPSLAQTHCAHGFFGRRGGISEGIFADLNCGYGSGDSRANVRENRARVARALGVGQGALLTAYQIHSPRAVTVRAPWEPDAAPQADAMVTDVPGIAIAILAADCAPVLFVDGGAHIVGAAHAGWKGALGGVLEATVAAMEALGAVRSRINAVVGPCISQANYEVGAEFRARFLAADAGHARFFAEGARPGHHQFDLPGFVGAALRRAEVGQVSALDACTYGSPEAYFSYRLATHRNEPDYGRNISAILLKD